MTTTKLCKSPLSSQNNSINNNAHRSVVTPLTTHLNLRSGGLEESELFGLSATLAREAGCDDLDEEFLDRSVSRNSRASVANKLSSPSIEADCLQNDDCRLISEGKLSDAEVAFRKAIKLDPSCADAHGNLGVAFAQQRKLPEAEAAFLLAIRFDPANVTMCVNLATCLIQQKWHQEEVWAQQAIQQPTAIPPVASPHRPTPKPTMKRMVAPMALWTRISVACIRPAATRSPKRVMY
jgi:tetratricopeptide (TPR) repeat protein